MNENQPKNKLILAVAIFILFVDRLSKLVALRSGFVKNQGISFGLLVDFPLVLIFASLAIIFILAKKWNNIGLTLILVGGLANIFDRIFLGYTIDFIYLPLIPFVFNMADVAIVLGLAIWFL